MKISKVYTRTGDKGQTSIVGGIRMSKASKRLEAYGTVDELNSHLGLLVAMLPDGNDRDMIIRIQSCLFNVCTNLATDQSQTPLYDSAKLPQGEIELLEQEVDRMMKLFLRSRALSFLEVLRLQLKHMFVEQSVVGLNVESCHCQKRPKSRRRHCNM